MEQAGTQEALAPFPLLEQVVLDLQEQDGLTTDEAVNLVAKTFDADGPYETAKQFNVIFDRSGEQFAVEFMSFSNIYLAPGKF